MPFCLLHGYNLVTLIFIFVTIVNVFSAGGHKESEKIIGGEYANQRRYPYIVSIQLFSSRWSHSCGGSILSPRVILTACHCLYVQPHPLVLRRPSSMRVIAGTGRLDYFQQEARAQQLIAHPDCGRPFANPAQYYHDVGIIILRTSLTYNAQVQPLKVFSEDPTTAFNELLRLQRNGAWCEIPGWGLVSTAPETTTNYLKVAYKNLMTSRQCNNVLCGHGSIFCVDFDQADQVCAVGQVSSVCNGDSGGPMVCNGFVFGVVSYGLRCGKNIPQVFSTIRPILYFYNTYKTYLSRKVKKKN